MAHGDAREGKWRENWRMEWLANTLHTTSEHGVSSITTADAHTSAASSRLNWMPWRFKWTRPFRRKTKSGFCACANTFQLASTLYLVQYIFENPIVNISSGTTSAEAVKKYSISAYPAFVKMCDTLHSAVTVSQSTITTANWRFTPIHMLRTVAQYGGSEGQHWAPNSNSCTAK